MYSGLYNVSSAMFSSPLTLFQGIRAFFPLISLYLSILWFVLKREKLPSFSSPLGLFLAYGLTGVLASLASPNKEISLYWGGMYLAPIFGLALVANHEEALRILKRIIWINYVVAIGLTVMFFPEMWRIGFMGQMRQMFYSLPFGLGVIRANGVGRLALITLTVSSVRFLYKRGAKHYFWLGLIIPGLYLLAQSQSRTALLGLAVSSLLFALIWQLRWQFFLIGPGVAYLLYVVGYKWRAQEKLAMLFTLTGREFTWKQALEYIKQSPLLGWGFHTDRLLLNSQHIHNSYIHAMIHGGLVATLFFVAAIIKTWTIIFREKLIWRLNDFTFQDQPYLIESICLLGFLTSRSLFESTAAFYGVDLLFFLPAALFIELVSQQNRALGEDAG
jgi:O-antigen ligase